VQIAKFIEIIINITLYAKLKMIPLN